MMRQGMLIAAMLAMSGAAWGQTVVCSKLTPEQRAQTLECSTITGSVTYPDGGEWYRGSVPIKSAAGSYDTIIMGNPAPITTITLGSETGHEVTIHLDTGKIDYPGAPDEAARAFWAAVQQLMPEYVRKEGK